MPPGQDGLFVLSPAPAGGGEIKAACEVMFKQLEDKDCLGPVELAKRPLLYAVAEVLDRELAGGRLSVAAAQAFKQYTDTLDSLPLAALSGDDSLDALEVQIAVLTRAAFGEAEQ